MPYNYANLEEAVEDLRFECNVQSDEQLEAFYRLLNEEEVRQGKTPSQKPIYGFQAVEDVVIQDHADVLYEAGILSVKEIVSIVLYSMSLEETTNHYFDSSLREEKGNVVGDIYYIDGNCRLDENGEEVYDYIEDIVSICIPMTGISYEKIREMVQDYVDSMC